MDIFAEAANVDYHSSFPNQKKNELLFFVCRKHMDVCRFQVPFAANPQKLPFSGSPVFHINITIYHYRYVKNSALVPLTFISLSIGWLLKALTFESVDFESVDF
jgi:hypothetical protein